MSQRKITPFVKVKELTLMNLSFLLLLAKFVAGNVSDPIKKELNKQPAHSLSTKPLKLHKFHHTQSLCIQILSCKKRFSPD